MNKLRITLIVCGIVGMMIFNSCNSCRKEQPKTADEDKQEMKIKIPDFSEDSAYKHIVKQLSFGPRVPNTKAHAECAAYLEEKLKEYIKDVDVQTAKVKTFNNVELKIKNIIGRYNKDAVVRILLCSHWDSRPWADKDEDVKNHTKAVPAANDGASGVGVLLEVARQLSKVNLKIGVDIIFLDAEDYGDYENDDDSWGLGSQYWAKKPHVENYTARFGILLDMVGAANATFPMEAVSMQYAPDVMRKVWDVAAMCGYSEYFVEKNMGAITDDHVYINKYLKIPTIDIIHYNASFQTGFFPYWHTTKDDLNCINKNTLKAVGQTLLAVAYMEK